MTTPIPEAAVEAAARAMRPALFRLDASYPALERERDTVRAFSRAALAAALPALRAQVLAPVVALHADDGDGWCVSCSTGWPCTTARAVLADPESGA